jgi:hypothetical protein
MPKQTTQDNRSDEEIAATNNSRNIAIGATGLAGAAAIGNQVHRQIIGNRLLNMMYQSQEGRKLLTKVGAVADIKDPNFNKKDTPKSVVDKVKERVSTSSGTKSTGQSGGRVGKTNVVSKTKIRQSATDQQIQSEIKRLVNDEIARITETSKKITNPLDASQPADNTVAVEKSMDRKKIETEKTTGRSEVKQARADQPAVIAAAKQEVKKAKERPNPSDTDIQQARDAAVQSRLDLEAAKLGANGGNVGYQADQDAGRVRDAITARMPELVTARRSLIRQYNAAVKALGPKPKTGTSSSSRTALAEWNEKQKQITAMKSQLDTIDQVVTKSGGLAPGYSVPTDDAGGRKIYPSIDEILAGGGRMGNTELAGNVASLIGNQSQNASTPGRYTFGVEPDADVAAAKTGFNNALGNYNTLQNQQKTYDFNINRAENAATAASQPIPPYAQPRMDYPEPGEKFSFEVPVEPSMPFYAQGRDAVDPYANLGIRGDIIPERPFNPAMDRNAIFDTGQFTDWMGKYNAELPSVQPRTAVQDTGNLGRLRAIASSEKFNTDEPNNGLIKRLQKLLGGGVSPSAVTNASNQATIKANNDNAMRAFSGKFGHGPDMNNPEHVKWLEEKGYSKPSLATRDVDGLKSGGLTKITLPDFGWGRRAEAFDAAQKIGLRTGNANPTLIGGKTGRVKGYLGSVAGGVIPLAAGYMWNRAEGAKAEEDAKAQIAKAKVEAPKVKQAFSDNATIQHNAANVVQTMAGLEGSNRINPNALAAKAIQAIEDQGSNKELREFYLKHKADMRSAIITEAKKIMGGK